MRQTRPDLIEANAPTTSTGSRWVVVGMVIALALTLVSPLADPNPDGLERVAEDQGFIVQAQDPTYTILPDYTVPFIESEAFTTIAAGVIGVLVVAGVGFVMARWTDKKQLQVSDAVDHVASS